MWECTGTTTQHPSPPWLYRTGEVYTGQGLLRAHKHTNARQDGKLRVLALAQSSRTVTKEGRSQLLQETFSALADGAP